MSTRVEVRIDQWLEGDTIDNGAIVEIRALSEAGHSRLVERVSVPVSANAAHSHAVNLDPGRYDFTAMLPSGEVVSETVDVVAGTPSVAVTLDSGSSPHEWLSWQRWNGNVSDRRETTFLKANLGKARPEVRTAFDAVDVAFWTAGNAVGALPDPVWQALSKSLSELDEGETIDPNVLRPANYNVAPVAPLRDDPYMSARLPIPAHAAPNRAYLAVRLGQQAMLCAMPWPWVQMRGGDEALVEAVIAIEEDLIEDADGMLETPRQHPVWSVRPAVRDRVFGGMLAYFASGEPGLARQLLRPARQLLFGKMMNPFGAAGGAYILVSDWIAGSAGNAQLAAGETSQDWMGWVRNLAQWFPWLPDGAILEGWLALRLRDQEPQLKEARASLLEAERRGIPLYTVGVRRLVDGLLLLSGEMRRQGKPDAEVDAALARVRRLAWQIDPRQPFTCIRLWSL